MTMFRKEFRVILPMTVDEYQVAQLWSVAEASKNETGGGEGIEILKNEPYVDGKEAGQFTHKIYHLASRVPGYVRLLAPNNSLMLEEKAWNAYPYCKTVFKNDYMKDHFEICIQSLHLPDGGESENVHRLPEDEWKKTQIVKIDIANDKVASSDYDAKFDPAKFLSQKSGRGKLSETWINDLKYKVSEWNKQPNGEKPALMCAYKLVSCRFKWFGLQSKIENLIQNQEKRLFTNFHRQVFCWIDNWFGMTMEQIRELEDKTKKDLDSMRAEGNIRGTVVLEKGKEKDKEKK